MAKNEADTYLAEILEQYYLLGKAKEVIGLDTIKINAPQYVTEIIRLTTKQ